MSCNKKKSFKFPNFDCEDKRLSTFNEWSHPFVAKDNLAFNGFFYRGFFDYVVCFVCGVELGSWELNDDVNYEHGKNSKLCPIVKGDFILNYPTDHKAWRALRLENRYQMLRKKLLTTKQHTVFNDEFKEMALMKNRIKSFINTPIEMPLEFFFKFTEAGFFYSFESNCAKCFSCLGEISLSEEAPMESHAVLFSECIFIRLTKGDHFIIRCLSKEPPLKIIRTSDCEMKPPLIEYSIDGCKICFRAPEETQLHPCLHKCVCISCAQKITQCPVCCQHFQSISRLEVNSS